MSIAQAGLREQREPGKDGGSDVASKAGRERQERVCGFGREAQAG